MISFCTLPSASSQFSLSLSLALTIPLALPSLVPRPSRFPRLHTGPNIIDHGKNIKYILEQPLYTCYPLERSKYLRIASSATPPFLFSDTPSPFAVFYLAGFCPFYSCQCLVRAMCFKRVVF